MCGIAMGFEGTPVTVDLEKKKNTGYLGTLVDVECEASWFGPSHLGVATYPFTKLLDVVFANAQMSRMNQMRNIPRMNLDGHHFALVLATAAPARPPVFSMFCIVSLRIISCCGEK